MRVYLGSDHAGYELKKHLVTRLAQLGHEAVDCGPGSYVVDDDYPPYVMRAAARVVDDVGSLGVVIGGSGNGEAMAANKIPGVRAALAWSEDTARLGREHNNANVVAIGARMHTIERATQLVELFLATSFSGDPRHQRRIDMITAYEKGHELPPLP